MRINKCLLPVLAATATLAGCAGGSGSGSGPGSGDRPDIPLAGTHWSLDAVTVDGAKRTSPAPGAYVEFKPDGTAQGTAGCNHFSSEDTSVDGDTVTVGRVTMTEKGCEKPVQDFEDAFHKAFSGKLEARLDDGGDRLTLTTGDGDTLVFSEQPEAPLKNTRWTVDTLLEKGTSTALPAGAKNKPHFTIGADGTARGNLGCNHFTAPVKIDGDKLTFGSITMTRRMCAQPQNELERKLYGTLGSGPVTYRVEQRALTVTAPDGSGFGAGATTP
ncbi:META domain-containing protein [Streptomyces sudanensis]|uniref:META domain-containing protein n=1 Tax=Streptomyces sudanensis TaxID=436397 RepID=UPI0020CEC329|nr:META domain-containing protein [Streptomyces sudanensis]MCP9958304.1 META domain-containing protein [Streptomyces sudanensis]MCP9987441.1 META domain-containing protein [Streptomyces sudanensis]MCQ0001178.1 META domain-containing protein [Streptomyces sudanensis]